MVGRLAGTLVFLCLAASGAHADSVASFTQQRFVVTVAARASANLVYQLDCLSGVIRCSREDYERLWVRELSLSTVDRKQLDEWNALRVEVQRDESRTPEPVVRSVLPLGSSGTPARWDVLRGNEYAAGSADELARVWQAGLSAERAGRALRIVAHFRPRFDAWWRAHEAAAAAFVPSLEDALRKARGFELLSAAARFFEAELGDGRVYVDLMVKPRSDHSSGQRIRAHLLAEFSDGEGAVDRAAVVIHELAHHVFGSIPAEKKAVLMERIVASGGAPAWNLLDEVQATVVGNVLAERNLQTKEAFRKIFDTPMSLYADEAIDLGARSTFALFEQRLANGKASDPDFAPAFADALRKGLGAKLDRPTLHLRSMLLNSDQNEDLQRKIIRSVRASSAEVIEPVGDASVAERLVRYPALSAVVLVDAGQVDKLAGIGPSLGVSPAALIQVLGASRGVAHVAKRSEQAYSFVFVAKGEAAMIALIDKFGACELKLGVCVRVD